MSGVLKNAYQSISLFKSNEAQHKQRCPSHVQSACISAHNLHSTQSFLYRYNQRLCIVKNKAMFSFKVYEFLVFITACRCPRITCRLNLLPAKIIYSESADIRAADKCMCVCVCVCVCVGMGGGVLRIIQR